MTSLLFVIAIAFLAMSCASAPSSSPVVQIEIGGTWTAIEILGRSPDALDAPRIQFTDAGQIQGVTGCSDFSGDVRIEGSLIAFEALRQSATPCRADLREMEAAFLAALRGAQQLSGGRDTGRLVIAGPDGEIVFVQPAP